MSIGNAPDSPRDSGNESEIFGEIIGAISQGIAAFGETNFDYVSPRVNDLLEVPESIVSAGKPWMGYFEFLKFRGEYGEGEAAEADEAEAAPDVPPARVLDPEQRQAAEDEDARENPGQILPNAHALG